MVLPEREVPGTSANTCAKPTTSASRIRISSTLCTRASVRALRFSTHKITKAPTTSATATLSGLNSFSLICLLNSKPITAAGIKATARLSTNRLAAASLPKPFSTETKRWRYSTTTANTAPSWMAISNTLPLL